MTDPPRQLLHAWVRDTPGSGHTDPCTPSPEVAALTGSCIHDDASPQCADFSGLEKPAVRPLPAETGKCTWASVQALPRVVEVDGPRLRFSAIPELATLRTGSAVHRSAMTVQEGKPVTLRVPNAQQMELHIRFKVPSTKGAKCGVRLLASAELAADGSPREYTELGVGYEIALPPPPPPPPPTPPAPGPAPSLKLKRWMAGVDMPGNDYKICTRTSCSLCLLL